MTITWTSIFKLNTGHRLHSKKGHFTLVTLWCGGRAHGHVNTKIFSDAWITKFSYPWCSAARARAPLSLNLSFFLYALKVERDFETKINMKSKRSSYPRPVCFCSPGWYAVSHFSGKFSNSLVKQLSATKTQPWYPALFVSWFLLLFISVVNYGWIAETTKTFLAKIGLVIAQTETNSFCGRIELKNTFAFSSFNGMFWIWVFF